MIYTQRQLEELHKANGAIVLPYRARLSPLALDWVRSRKISIEYRDVPPSPSTLGEGRGEGSASGAKSSGCLWWCDGPCGPSKAAIVSLERESNLRPLDIQQSDSAMVSALKAIAHAIRSGQCDGAILLVRSGARAMLFANRCPSIRAVLGTCIESVEQGLRQVAANVLVIEHPYKTLSQARTLATRFVKAPRSLSEEVSRQLQELSTCA